MTIDPGLAAVIAVAVVFIVWYIAGSVWNRRLARRIANEMRDSLLSLGGTSRVQAFGLTAFRMTTEGANPPFRDVSVIVTLQPREMPINWALAYAQGRRDAAIVEASLRQTPRVGFEIVDPTTRVGRRRARTKSSWSTTNVAGHEYLLSSKNAKEVESLLGQATEETLGALAALHVTAGSEPGIAASVSVEAGRVAPVIQGLRHLVEAMTS